MQVSYRRTKPSKVWLAHARAAHPHHIQPKRRRHPHRTTRWHGRAPKAGHLEGLLADWALAGMLNDFSAATGRGYGAVCQALTATVHKPTWQLLCKEVFTARSDFRIPTDYVPAVASQC